VNKKVTKKKVSKKPREWPTPAVKQHNLNMGIVEDAVKKIRSAKFDNRGRQVYIKQLLDLFTGKGGKFKT
jgi:hypothetical protein